MKKYKVMLTVDAEADLRFALAYLRNKFKNPQAVKNVMEDYTQTRKALEQVADSLSEPESARLRQHGLKRIHFKRRNYFMLYYIDDDMAVVTNIFHDLEDFESKLR